MTLSLCLSTLCHSTDDLRLQSRPWCLSIHHPSTFFGFLLLCIRVFSKSQIFCSLFSLIISKCPDHLFHMLWEVSFTLHHLLLITLGNSCALLSNFVLLTSLDLPQYASLKCHIANRKFEIDIVYDFLVTPYMSL